MTTPLLDFLTMLPLFYAMPAMILYAALKLLRLAMCHLPEAVLRQLDLAYYERWLDLAFVGSLPRNVVLWPRQEQVRSYILTAAVALASYAVIVPLRLILL